MLLCSVTNEQTAKDIVAGIEALERLKKIEQFVPNYSKRQADKQMNVDRFPKIGKWSYSRGIIPHKIDGGIDKIVYNLFDEEKRFVVCVDNESTAQNIVEDVNKTIAKIIDRNNVSECINDWKEYVNTPPTVETLTESIKKIITNYNELIVNSVLESLKKDQ